MTLLQHVFGESVLPNAACQGFSCAVRTTRREGYDARFGAKLLCANEQCQSHDVASLRSMHMLVNGHLHDIQHEHLFLPVISLKEGSAVIKSNY